MDFYINYGINYKFQLSIEIKKYRDIIPDWNLLV